MDSMNSSSKDIILSKIQLSKIIQKVGFLARILETLINVGLPLMKNVLTFSAKGVLVPTGLTAAASAADAAIHKKMLGSGTKTLIKLNEGMREIVKFLEDSSLLTRYRGLVNQPLKHNMIQTNKVLKRRWKMLAKTYLILVG